MIHYRFTFNDGVSLDFEIDETRPLEVETLVDPPEWLQLASFRCEHCSLPEDAPLCPAAVAIRPVVEAFNERVSYDQVTLEIRLRDRIVQTETQNQEALRSLVGLLLPLSSCPVMSKLRPLARYHEPLADPEHTVFRVFGMHLLAQFLRQREGLDPDWQLDALKQMYADIHAVNARLADRLRAVAVADANLNSVALLDVMAHAVDWGFDRSLEKLKELFEPHLKD